MSFVLPDVIHEGERNDTLFRYACSLRAHDLVAHAILEKLRKANARCRPPLDDDELWRLAQSAERYPSGSLTPENIVREAKLWALNKAFAVIRIGKDTLILEQQRNGKIALLSERAFRLWVANKFVANGNGKREPIALAWRGWDYRREYERLVFKPGDANVPNNEFNLWRGWAVAPRDDRRCDRILRHLQRVVCGGHAKHYEWLLDWLADIVQRPQRKLGHVVALRGAQGVGKSVVGYVMKRILGDYQTVAEKPEHVVGRFNWHIAHCLLLQAEEAFWGGDKRARSVLKHLVSGQDQMIERKGIDAIPMPNYTRLLITSNEEWVWPTELGDRRLVIFDVKPTHKDDVRYFDALFAEIDAEGAAAFLHFLQHRVINDRRLKVPPTTRALEEQAVLTMPADESWLRHLVIEGGRLPPETIVDGGGYAHAPVGALYERYVANVPRGQYVRSEEQFGVFLTQHLRSKKVAYGGRARYRNAKGALVLSRGCVLLPLATCRKRYSERGRAAPQAWGPHSRWRIEK